MKLLCKLGFHDWTLWSSPRDTTVQTRQCKRCGMAERRNIEIADYEPYLSQKTQDRLRELAEKGLPRLPLGTQAVKMKLRIGEQGKPTVKSETEE